MNLGLSLTITQTPVCNRTKVRAPCDEPVHDEVSCDSCGRKYHRCEKHGGAVGAKRSLTSHKGVCFERPRGAI